VTYCVTIKSDAAFFRFLFVIFFAGRGANGARDGGFSDGMNRVRELLMSLLPTGLRDRLLSVRDRLLLDPRFHRWAFALPGTRGLAQAETRALFDVCAGFVYTQVLLACVRIGLFETLKAGPLSAEGIAQSAGLSVAATERLLAAAVSLRLVSRRGGQRYGLGTLGAAVAGNPSIGAMVEHHAALYADLRDPIALLRDEKPATQMGSYWTYAGAKSPGALVDEDVADYTALMSTSQVMIAQEVLDAYDFRGHAMVLDVGGGDGTFLSALAKRVPNVALRLFDLPPVAARAQARFEAEGLSGRAIASGGDFYADPLPQGADMITLVRVLFDHDDASARKILKAVHAALPQNGTLLIAEPMSGTRGAEPIGDAYFSFYLLAMGRGCSRTLGDFAELLAETGFDVPRLVATKNPLLTRIVAVRPKKEAGNM
jgi:demethylspheroidene O-methyltransferase